MEMLGAASGGTVLLLGEAEGLLASRLERERGARVTWFDPAGPGEEGGPYDLPFEDCAFEAVASQFAIERVEEASRALREWGRVLDDGGLLVVVTRNALFGGAGLRRGPRALASHTPEGLRSLVERSGFRVKTVCTLLPDLKLPKLYRGDLSFSLKLEVLPWFRDRGMLLFASAFKDTERSAVGGQGRA